MFGLGFVKLAGAPWRKLALTLTLVVFAFAPAGAQSPLEPLTFQTAQGARIFQVEIMRKPEELSKGLMYRRYLPEDRGMLFLFEKPRVLSMWMKNTYIPLDMVFLDSTGKIVSIAKDTEPLSETIILSQGIAAAVVELNAGVADKAGLKAGDLAVATALGRVGAK